MESENTKIPGKTPSKKTSKNQCRQSPEKHQKTSEKHARMHATICGKTVKFLEGEIWRKAVKH
jgi:predicted house-cleaning NTP pyrophosphatase (Maf/HAM1 superfamily)